MSVFVIKWPSLTLGHPLASAGWQRKASGAPRVGHLHVVGAPEGTTADQVLDALRATSIFLATYASHADFVISWDRLGEGKIISAPRPSGGAGLERLKSMYGDTDEVNLVNRAIRHELPGGGLAIDALAALNVELDNPRPGRSEEQLREMRKLAQTIAAGLDRVRRSVRERYGVAPPTDG